MSWRAFALWPEWQQSLQDARARLGGYDPAWSEDWDGAHDRYMEWAAEHGEALLAESYKAVQALGLPSAFVGSWQQAFVQGAAIDPPATFVTVTSTAEGTVRIEAPFALVTRETLDEATERALRLASLIRRADGVPLSGPLQVLRSPALATAARQERRGRRAAWVRERLAEGWSVPRIRKAWPASLGPLVTERAIRDMKEREARK